jgi:hypothetical protein
VENFNLKKFLVENKLTSNSKLLKEVEDTSVRILEVLQNYSSNWISFEEFKRQEDQNISGDGGDYDPSEGEWPSIPDEYDSVEEVKGAVQWYNGEVGRDMEIVAIKLLVNGEEYLIKT